MDTRVSYVLINKLNVFPNYVLKDTTNNLDKITVK